MSNHLSFDLIPSESGRKLAISGPTGLMRAAYSHAPRESAMHRIGNKRIYSTRLSEDEETLTWILHAQRLGGAHNQDKRDDSLRAINGFIHEALRLARKNKVKPDPSLNMRAYAPDGMGELNFVADVVKPSASTTDVRRLLAGTMLGMVNELHYPRRGMMEEYARTMIADRTHYGTSGVKTSLDTHSSLGSIPEDWNWANERFELVGHNVDDCGQALIYLAGTIAIAKADVILGTRTLVEQR